MEGLSSPSAACDGFWKSEVGACHDISLDLSPQGIVENKLSDMHSLLTRVRHSKSFTYPIRLFPYITTWSIDLIRNSLLIRLLLSSTSFPLTPFPLLIYVAVSLYK